MKRKEFLQKSAVIAAVTLAAAVMEPGMVRAAELPDQEVSAQVLDQSEEDTSVADVSEVSESSDEQISDETAGSEADTTSEADSSIAEDSSDTEATEDTISGDAETVSDSETTVDASEVSDSEISSSSEINSTESEDTSAEANETTDETSAQLQTPGWTTREDGTTGYQNEDGSLCADTIKEINGKLYYFNTEGALVKNDVFQYDYDYYKASEDGSLYRSCWDGYSYYDQNGKQQRNCIIELNGKYYGFNSEGQRYENKTFYFFDADDICTYYHAQEDGTLATNAWLRYETQDFYLGANGASIRGLQTIDGKNYYFNDSNCGLVCNSNITIDGKNYFSLNSGVIYEVPSTDGWVQFEDEKYYAEDGKILKNCVKKIGDYYYCFDYYGTIYTDEIWLAWNPSAGKSCYFYADKDGHLKTNTWGTGGYANYYFGEDGFASYNGVHTIDGKQYYFVDGWIQRNGTVNDNGQTYLCLSDGSLISLSRGWNYINSDWYYVENGQLLKNCIFKIKSDYYAFDSDGRMQNYTLFTFTEDGQTISCFAQEGGKLLTNASITYGSTTYYFDAEGKFRNGLQTIDGKQYYLVNGQMKTNEALEIDGSYYLADSTGQLKQISGDTGWYQLGEQWYYIKDQHFLKNTVEKIGNKYYGFSSNGIMYKNTFFSLSRYADNTYYAKKDGSLLQNEWYSASTGTKYFYDENCELVTDTSLEIDGSYYLADGDGQLEQISANTGWYQSGEQWYYIKDQHFLKNTVEKIGNKYYGFSSTGAMYRDTSFSFDQDDDTYYAKKDGTLFHNEWYYSSTGKKRFYGEDCKLVTDISSVTDTNGTLYYSGTNEAFYDSDTNTNYAADGEGILHKLNNNDWTKVGDYWYYVKDSKIVKYSILNLGNAYYGFSEKGHLYVDTVFTFTTDGGWTILGTYFADKDGKVRVDSTADTWNTGYYFGEDGKGYTGMKTIQNVKYYFSNGELRKNDVFTYDGINYVSGADGRVLVLPQNGWTQVDGLWYYVSNGTLIYGKKFEINGKTYLFHRNGYMITNAILSTSQGVYAADQNGVFVKDGWVKRPRTGGWMYFDSNGSYVGTGIQTIHGKKYYFSYNSMLPELVTNRIVRTENKIYIADGNGVLNPVNLNGWNKFSGYWYYFVNGKEISDEIIKIGNAYYGFDSQGHMYDDTDFYYSDDNVYGRFRAAAGGALIFQDTVTIDGVSYTYDENGVGLKGYHTVNGTSYYFIGGQKAVNRAFFDGSRYCAADASGKLYSLTYDTWTKVGSYYYYVKDNEILKNTMLSIGGKYYAFDSYGRMLTNQFYYSTYRNDNPDEIIFGMVGDYTLDPIRYRASASGAFLCNEWYEDETGKYYFDGNGIGYEGTHWINGKRYTFSQGKVIAESAPVSKPSWEKDSKGWWYRHADGSYAKNGWEKINGKYYLFNASGYMLTGWQNVKGTWYYMNANGDMTSKAWQKLNGKWYYFNADGSMTSNAWQKLNNKWYYFNADGVMITKSWRQIAGKWYYFEADGSMAGKGWHQLNGKWYYMYDSGIMATNTWIGNSYVDANGVWTKSK